MNKIYFSYVQNDNEEKWPSGESLSILMFYISYYWALSQTHFKDIFGLVN